MRDRKTLHRFYTEGPLDPGSTVYLDRQVAEQIRRVLRLRTDDRVTVFDGSGLEAVARITSLSQDRAAVELEESPVTGRRAAGPEIYLGQSLLKADRFDLVVQKATELGVSGIIPIESERCVVSLPADRARSRLERWRRIATEALEQSGRADTVHIEHPMPLAEALTSMAADRRLIAWENESNRSIVDLLDGADESVAVLIGPEGGFADTEVRESESAGFAKVSLGDLTLRSETAAIAAIAMIRAAVEVRRESR